MTKTDLALLRTAKGVIEAESRAVRGLVKTLDAGFVKAVRLIAGRPGKTVLLGVGKSGLIARKIAATLASTGTRSLYLHPVETLHGDLGMIAADDIAIALSYSGETEETAKLVPILKKQGLPVIAVTNNTSSRLARCADIVLRLHVRSEACPHGIVPTSSTTAMLALGDALAVCLMSLNGFDRSRFARLHPGGNLGKLLNIRVRDLMHKGRKNPVVREGDTLARALEVMTRTKAGAVSVTGAAGELTGYFTDGDIRRCLQGGRLSALSGHISALMTRSPLTVHPETMAIEAARLISEKRVDNLPVTDSRTGRPVGIIDERDLLKEGLI
ncbi:MAG: KpsF/GutQ family sugar-phosphate isomerase [Elusimicrobia bacterium CG08_land_8_20_14_0_20_59_10]|nr:MAG: KpsF/GutQ family sugar-phosphate isomerase [Elusimicrobia bacterium CG08_land_8_20_14_0_20_59_10]